MTTSTRCPDCSHAHAGPSLAGAPIAAGTPTDHKAAGCEWESDHWLCEDEDGRSRHPLDDHASELAEYLDVALAAIPSGWHSGYVGRDVYDDACRLAAERHEDIQGLAEVTGSLTAYATEIHKRGHREGCDSILLGTGCSCDWLPAWRILSAFPEPAPAPSRIHPKTTREAVAEAVDDRTIAAAVVARIVDEIDEDAMYPGSQLIAHLTGLVNGIRIGAAELPATSPASPAGGEGR
jgi:hypothetical protein